jgi:hypothetical protein
MLPNTVIGLKSHAFDPETTRANRTGIGCSLDDITPLALPGFTLTAEGYGRAAQFASNQYQLRPLSLVWAPSPAMAVNNLDALPSAAQMQEKCLRWNATLPAWHSPSGLVGRRRKHPINGCAH